MLSNVKIAMQLRQIKESQQARSEWDLNTDESSDTDSSGESSLTVSEISEEDEYVKVDKGNRKPKDENMMMGFDYLVDMKP